MNTLFRITICVIFLLTGINSHGQHRYTPPRDEQVIQRLNEWQDRKFGLFMHWGTYSQWGIVESWSLCPEDEGWTIRKGPYANDYYSYKKAYEGLQGTFHPEKFDPSKWARAAKEAGMGYVVFTTKHHDGFCMFDSKQTNYTIANPLSGYSKDPKKNIALEIFNAFRTEGFMTGAYFSKPDWHNNDYWWSYFPPKDRNVNYNPAKYPEKWKAFQDFTYKQIEELMTGYGKLDILWLDGGWVRPLSSVDTSVIWQKGIKDDQDINMPRIAGMARQNQPGIIIVDRTVPGEFENYTTPEQEIPEEPLPYPWETCMTMGNSWSYVPNDQYKPARQIIHNLIRIVSRGGNYLLNIGPGPDGDFDPVAYDRLREIGSWMRINAEGIYGSSPLPPYSQDNVFYTQNKKTGTRYAFLLLNDTANRLPEKLLLKNIYAPKEAKISILGTSSTLKWVSEPDGIAIQIPARLRENLPGDHALCFVIKR
jgi:alpha-L-fucosidase